jgi:hypothetical protein
VDDTHTIVLLDVCVEQHLEGNLAESFGKVVEDGLVTPIREVRSLALPQNLVLGLLRVLVKHLETSFQHDIALVALGVVYKQVFVVGVNTKCQVAGQRPWRSGPCNKVDLVTSSSLECLLDLRADRLGLLARRQHGERDGDSRVLHILVFFLSLTLAEWCVERCAVWQDARTVVDQVLLVKLLEHPPAALHEGRVHGLVVPVEIDPASQPANDLPPLIRVGHDNLSAPPVVFGNTDLVHGSLASHTKLFLQLLVDNLLDGHTVGVPAKATLDIAAAHAPVTRDDVLDGRGE